MNWRSCGGSMVKRAAMHFAYNITIMRSMLTIAYMHSTLVIAYMRCAHNSVASIYGFRARRVK